MCKNKVLIIGGGVENKGAQAMTFYVCSLLQSISADIEPVVLVSEQEHRNQANKYNINLYGINPLSLLRDGEFLFRIISRVANLSNKTDIKLSEILSTTVMAIDISGYGLSSTFGVKTTLKYLGCISACKTYGIPMIILPQSFGPFDYKGIYKLFIRYIVKHELRYPYIVYARERASYELLSDKIRLKNIRYHHDVVLACDESKFFHFIKQSDDVVITKQNAVCIIPSTRIIDRIGVDVALDLYTKVIKRICWLGYKAVLAAHSNEDIDTVLSLSSKCSDEGIDISLYTDDINSYNACNFFSGFEFLITSRYHSVIHAYKTAVPCVVVGWANKYLELMNAFCQRNYLVDLSADIEEQLIETVDNMSKVYEKESQVIRDIISREDNSEIENEIKIMLGRNC